MVSQAAALRGIRALLEGVEGITHAFSMGDSDAKRLPPALPVGVSALVFPGSTTEFIFGVGSQRHTYEVEVLIAVEGSDVGVAGGLAAVLVDRVVPVLIGSVSSEGGLWNSLVFKRSGGAEVLEYGGREYQGYRIYLEVSEQGSATPGSGA